MNETFAEWRKDRAELVFDRQRAQADSPKLLTTFAAGLAATLLASALQTPNDGASGPLKFILEIVGAGALAVSFLLVLEVIRRDRIKAPDVGALATQTGITEDDRKKRLRDREFAAEEFNEDIIGEVRAAAKWQLFFAALAGVLATVSLLIP